MKSITDRNTPETRSRAPLLKRSRSGCGRALIAFGVLAVLAGNAQQTQQTQPSSNSAAPPTGPGRAWSSAQVVITSSNPTPQNFDALNAERKKQIADDSAKLLRLATELKSEVDKTTKDTLSLAVIRKADEIEHLARGVKEKMKLNASN